MNILRASTRWGGGKGEEDEWVTRPITLTQTRTYRPGIDPAGKHYSLVPLKATPCRVESLRWWRVRNSCNTTQKPGCSGPRERPTPRRGRGGAGAAPRTTVVKEKGEGAPCVNRAERRQGSVADCVPASGCRRRRTASHGRRRGSMKSRAPQQRTAAGKASQPRASGRRGCRTAVVEGVVHVLQVTSAAE